MPRQRFQRPKVFRSGKYPPVWRGEWHVYVQKNGKERRKHRSATLGRCSEMTRQQAQLKLDALVQQETSQTPKPDGSVTLQEFIESVYLPIRRRKWTSPNSRVSMEGTIRLHVLPALGKLPLAHVSKAVIEKHLGKLADKYGKELVERVRVILKSTLEEAYENDFIPKNPARKVERPACQPTEPSRSLTEAEVLRLLRSLSGLPRLLFRILILTGLRIGEVLALKWGDIGPDFIRVDETVLDRSFGPPKSRKTRLVPIPQSLQRELKAWREFAVEAPEDGLLFPSRQEGKPLSRRSRTVLGWLYSARKSAEIADLDFRMCRRTFATLVEGDVKDVQEMLGHAQAETTLEHYKKPVWERQREMVEKLDRRFSG